MDDGPDTALAYLDVAGPAYMEAVFKYPDRNIALRQHAQVIKPHDGSPLLLQIVW